jgi:hypothetical protein
MSMTEETEATEKEEMARDDLAQTFLQDIREAHGLNDWDRYLTARRIFADYCLERGWEKEANWQKFVFAYSSKVAGNLWEEKYTPTHALTCPI